MRSVSKSSMLTSNENKNESFGSIENLTFKQLSAHPITLFSCIPRDAALFVAGAIAGATAKTITAPLDRVKIQMQVQGVQAIKTGLKKGANFFDALVLIGRNEGIKGYWKGNLPQVIRVIPYSAVQLFAYEFYKKLFQGDSKELSVLSRLASGACAGMTSTFVTYPLDVLRLRLAVDSQSKSMYKVAMMMAKEEGFLSFYKGLVPSLIGIAPYIAINFCAFDLMKKSLPEELRKKPQSSFVLALLSSTIATVTCYPLDTVRRQMQMRNSPFTSILDAIPGIIQRDGVMGLYRGFLPNAIKNLPNNSIRLSTYDAAKSLLSKSEEEKNKLIAAGRTDIIS